MFTANIRYNDSSANIEFPCDNSYLYSKLMEMRVSEQTYQDLKLFVKKIDYDALSCLEDNFVDLGELNFLAQRLDSFSYQEVVKFNAVVKEFGIKTMPEFINLTYNMHYYTLLQDLSSAEKIGKTYMLTRNGGMSEKEILETDFEKIGKQLIESGRGRLTEHGLLFVNDDLPYDHEYNGVTLPCFFYRDCLFTVSMGYDGKTSYVHLPDVPYAISNAVNRLGAASPMDCKVEFEQFGIENIDLQERLKAVVVNEGIYKLNEIAAAIHEISDYEELQKLTDIIEFSGREDGDTIISLAKNIDEFIFYPDVADADALGRAIIEENEEYHIHPDIADYFMFEQYAEEIMRECDCKFTENGAVLLKSKTLTEILREEQSGECINRGIESM
ncbi:MAG: antirestriction protein ArdA [Clostridia bacterium]|nr:antirestriction protein ArdA [Clostridia bacterium]